MSKYLAKFDSLVTDDVIYMHIEADDEEKAWNIAYRYSLKKPYIDCGSIEMCNLYEGYEYNLFNLDKRTCDMVTRVIYQGWARQTAVDFICQRLFELKENREAYPFIDEYDADIKDNAELLFKEFRKKHFGIWGDEALM